MSTQTTIAIGHFRTCFNQEELEECLEIIPLRNVMFRVYDEQAAYKMSQVVLERARLCDYSFVCGFNRKYKHLA